MHKLEQESWLTRLLGSNSGLGSAGAMVSPVARSKHLFGALQVGEDSL